MFVGHLALGLAAKRVAPTMSLGWLIAGVTTLDLLWPLFLLAGLEHVTIAPGATAFTPFIFDHYPWTHSLLMSVVWGIGLAGLARTFGRPGHARLLMLLVVSHWVLDFASHAPDMPLWPGESPKFGLGLWRSIPATFLLEGGMWIAGIAVYLRSPIRSTGARAPRAAFWALIVVCTLLWAMGPFGPPPPTVRALALFALAGWIIVPWASFADRSPAGRRI
jgi:hypothetical protein